MPRFCAFTDAFSSTMVSINPDQVRSVAPDPDTPGTTIKLGEGNIISVVQPYEEVMEALENASRS